MMVRLRGSPVDVVIIVVYMPTSDHEDIEVETIYEQIEKIIKKGRKNDYPSVLGGLNASVGEMTERFGRNRNEKGQILIEFCRRNKLGIANTLFKQNKRRRYTWKDPGDIRRMQIDYIMVKQRYRG